MERFVMDSGEHLALDWDRGSQLPSLVHLDMNPRIHIPVP